MSRAVTEQQLADYSLFVRFAASLWELRREPLFDPIIASALTTASIDNLAHDEFVLFLAAKLRANGLPVVPPAPVAQPGVRNPDLAAANATAHPGPDVYFEIKERSPTARRTRQGLTGYMRGRIRECARQIAAREVGARGFASVDLGVVQEHQIPIVGACVREELERCERVLYGVLVSATLLKREETAVGNNFVPVFRSYMLVVEDRMYRGRSRLALPIIEALHRAFQPR